ncbi:MAG TPA: hypothetical protein PKA44_11495, partial [Saprospiraceae bacterium]|nr:hypothetical protein [Saprospiraceae bacterium]
MKRRKFLQVSTPMIVGPLVVQNNLLKPFVSGSLARMFNCEEVNDRVLVIVQLKGGNDGLNCLIPTFQYDTYKNFRPVIGIGQDKLIHLDTTLDNDHQVMLHPNLAPFKELYEKDQFSMVQGVGYANTNKPNFKGTD